MISQIGTKPPDTRRRLRVWVGLICVEHALAEVRRRTIAMMYLAGLAGDKLRSCVIERLIGVVLLISDVMAK